MRREGSPSWVIFFNVMLVLINAKTGLYLGTWTDVMIDLEVEIALHHTFLVMAIVCAFPTAWGIRNLHQIATVEEKPFPSTVGCKSQSIGFCAIWVCYSPSWSSFLMIYRGWVTFLCVRC